MEGCKALMWHHHHNSYKDVIAAKRILSALQHAGIKVFPDFNTGWHFDDKVAQKYLLEAIGAPLVPSYVFYDKKEAIEWANKTTYPKVFKLKGGAGSANVKLVRTKSECIKLINKAFGKGFKQFDGMAYFLDSIKKYKSGTKSLKQVVKSFGRMLISTDYAKNMPPERGYAYFQEFVPNNDGDYRIIVIGQKYAYGMKRLNRKNDFRASGSSSFLYEKLPDSMLEVAFDVAKTLKLQSAAFDFIRDEDNKPLIIEMSYAFGTTGSSKCKGYWTDDLQFHPGSFNPYGWMVQNLYDSIIE
ncbi:ATP-grasp domain-containing protein [Niabella digestorum]|uniref:ATP-grasp domain-containing protein n=1 Tax=Niabella digestorum TaxID=3117701 RepID=A0ABU7REJ6_9BACT